MGGIFPDCYKISRIAAIPKPGKDHLELDSHRPINNLNPLEKIIEEAIKNQIDEYLDDKKVIPKEMHGVRKNHNTLTAKMSVDENINNTKNKNKNVVVLTTDLTAAYDTLDHALLLIKTEHIGLRGKVLELMNSYLSERMFYV